MTDPNSSHSDEMPLIRRGRVETLNIYEVKEHELELLEKGSAGTLQFNLLHQCKTYPIYKSF